MRRFCLLIFFVLYVFSIVACAPVRKDGLPNYDKHTCTVGLTARLFPSDEFLERFQYTEGDYHYWDSDDWIWGYAKTFAYLRYDPAVYQDAKQYCLEEFAFNSSNLHINTDNGYSFQEVYGSVAEYAIDPAVASNCNFPGCFNLFGFNDESNTLYFLGYYNGDPNSGERNMALTQFDEFINKVYGEYFP